jgi:ribonuclease E
MLVMKRSAWPARLHTMIWVVRTQRDRMKKEMLINVLQPEECRIAIVEDGVLEELYVERTSQESYVGNIYKGRIVNIEPSIQAAFVDFGIGRNGFLHVSDVEPAYYRHLEQQRAENGGRRGGRRRNPIRPAPTASPEEFESGEPSWEAHSQFVTPQAAGTGSQQNAAEPETRSGQRSSKESSRSRGRPRRRPPEPQPESPAEAAEPDTAAPSSSAPSEPAPSARPEPPRPELGSVPPEPPTRYMESAERRTEDADLPDPGPESSSTLSDEDIFFPRAAPEPAASTTKPAETLPVEPTAPAPEPAESPWSATGDEKWDLPPEQPAPEDGEDMETLSKQEEPLHQETLPTEEYSAEVAEERPARRRERERMDFAEEEYGSRRRRSSRDERRGRPYRRMSGRPGAGRPKPLIQDIFKRGQEVLVQVIKEGIGTKGPTLSTYISIAGRYLVLMPGLNRIGVSRKIADDEARRRLREIFHELQPPKGLGFIIRTAGIDKTKKELQRDLAYLSRLWQVVVRRIRKLKAPAEIYQESDMITRTIRDTFTSDIDTIWVDEPTAFEHAQEFLQIVMPRYAGRIKHYTGSEPLFHKYGIEKEIAKIQERRVELPHGGSIVIEQTEALVAIDVNSGSFRADNNAEETAYRMNLLAAKEIARQLRLRDLGGVIVNDFIDMREEKHRRDVERAMREAVKRDRARTKILKISQFGIIEMTRQRIRPSLKRSVYQDCPHCHGSGQVKTCESMSIDVMRMLQLAAHREDVHRIEARVHEDVANYLLNKKRKEITRLEESGNLQVTITAAIGVPPETLEFMYYDTNNTPHRFTPYEENRLRTRS